jgi:hypothetical protein
MSLIRPASVAALILSLLSAFSASAAAARGLVTGSGGNRLAGMVVQAWDAEGILRASEKTIADGTYLLTLQPGQYRLLAFDPAGVYATVVYPDAESFDVAPFATVSELGPNVFNFTLPFGASIMGTVTANGTPLTSAVVEVYNLSGTRRGRMKVNESGAFSLVVPVGDYKLFAYDENDFFAGEFSGGATTFVDAQSVRTVVGGAAPVAFDLERAAHISGTARDAINRQLIGNLSVYVYTVDGKLVATKKTDRMGAFRFTLQGGTYRFVAVDRALLYGPAFLGGGPSFDRSEVVTVVRGGERTGIELAVDRSAVIEGDVSNFGTQIVAYNLDGTVHARTGTDSFGEYRLIVAPGRYKLAAVPVVTWATQFHAHALDFASAQIVTVLSRQTLTIDFRPVRAGAVTGTVRDPSTGLPLAGMTVAAYSSNGAKTGETTTAADGSYTLLVAPGGYQIVAFDSRLAYVSGYGPQTTAVTADATVTVDLTMRRGTRVSGIVSSEDGRRAPGVEVVALDGGGRVVAGAVSSADGTFTLVLEPGTYTFRARTVLGFASAGPVTVLVTPPPPFSLVLEGTARRRATHR